MSLLLHAPFLSRMAVNLHYNSLIPETVGIALFRAAALPEGRTFGARGLKEGARNPGFELDTRWESHIPHLQNCPLSASPQASSDQTPKAMHSQTASALVTSQGLLPHIRKTMGTCCSWVRSAGEVSRCAPGHSLLSCLWSPLKVSAPTKGPQE